MKIAKLLAYCLFLVCLGTSAGYAQAVLDKDYKLINPPQPTANPGKIEVIEFFYYGCPHCFDLQPALKPWVKQLPPDVEFHRVPVYRDSWLPLTKLFFTLEALGEAARLHGEVYDALHIQNFDLRDEIKMLEWAKKQGLDEKKFFDAYESPEVQAKVQKAKEMTKNYGITGTPRLVVEGKYLTSSVMAGSHRAQIPVLDFLVLKAREERSAKK